MNKLKTAFFCSSCGAQTTKWTGKCNSCGEWNTIIEEVIQVSKKTISPIILSKKEATLISEVEIGIIERLNTNDTEFNRVLGGGIVPGSIILLSGEPGIGKSTLMLQIALKMTNYKILYVSGEESQQQIKIRANRLNINNNNLYLYTETDTQNILNQVDTLQPDIIIIDSIQTITSPNIESISGSISQIRETTTEIQKSIKEKNIPTFLIGHITKDGSIAGPKILEHIVDVVLNFEGERNYGYRILRSVKNRFGSTSEIGIYEMENSGLREITNPSEILISHLDEITSGIAIAASLEGIRTLMIETQVLVTNAIYGTAQRSCNGFDQRRLNMLLAVLEKKCGYKIGTKDVFLNITGGIKVDDPAIDLAIIAAIISSGEDIPLPNKICFAAEVGLSGEIRPVSRIEQRISEADKLGFKEIYISKNNLKSLSLHNTKIKITTINKIEDIIYKLFK